MTQTPDVIVLGAGIVGVATALHLLRRGKSVALVDRRGIGEETSFGNAGGIEASSLLPYPFPPITKFLDILADKDTAARVDLTHLPRVLPWLLRLKLFNDDRAREKSARALRPLLDLAVAEHVTLMTAANLMGYFRPLGWLKIYRLLDTFEKDALTFKLADALNVPYEIRSPDEMQDLEPSLIPAYYRAVWWKNSATATDPGAVTKGYGQLFIQEGGSFYHADARSLRCHNHRWEIDTERGTLSAHDAVIALGPWSDDVLRPLGYHYPIGIKRGYHCHYLADHGATLNRALIDADVGFALAPMTRGFRITTGAEFAALDAPPNPRQLHDVFPKAQQIFPLTSAVDEKPWMGARPCLPDSLPVIGPAPQHKGLWFNFGHGHLGFTLGPVCGRLLAEMLILDAMVADPSAFSPTRL